MHKINTFVRLYLWVLHMDMMYSLTITSLERALWNLRWFFFFWWCITLYLAFWNCASVLNHFSNKHHWLLVCQSLSTFSYSLREFNKICPICIQMSGRWGVQTVQMFFLWCLMFSMSFIMMSLIYEFMWSQTSQDFFLPKWHFVYSYWNVPGEASLRMNTTVCGIASWYGFRVLKSLKFS